MTNDLNLDLMIGGGILKTFVPSFNYEDTKFKSTEFDMDGYMSFGIGFRF